MTLWQNTRYGLRLLTKKPLTSLVAILSLAIGLGASATIFSFANAFLLRPLPVPEPDRLVEISHHRLQSQNGLMAYLTLSYPDLAYYRDHNNTFTEVVGFVTEVQKVDLSELGSVLLESKDEEGKRRRPVRSVSVINVSRRWFAGQPAYF